MATLRDKSESSDLEHYKMDHFSRGHVAIIDNYKFDNKKYPTLKGHQKDVENFKTTFEALGFRNDQIRVYENQTRKELIKIMNIYAKEVDFSDCDCFVAVFLSHGFLANNEQYIKSKDGSYGTEWPSEKDGASLDELTANFKACESLHEKPKIFLFDVCRGDKEEPSYSKSIENNKGRLFPQENNIQSNGQQSDFFFGWAPVSGYKTWASSKQGSWYSNVVCQVLKENFLTKEFTQMMTIVNDTLKSKYQGMTPTFQSTLRKGLYFSNLDKSVLRIMPKTDTIILPSSDLPERSKHFIGRDKYLKDIDSAYSSRNKKILVLSSIAGTGKTTLATEYGYRFKSFQNRYVYWVKSDGNNSDYYFQDFAQYDLKIALDERQKSEKKLMLKEIKNKLSRKNTEDDVLFIFDDCDDYQSIRDYLIMLSDINGVKILITTRSSTLASKLNPNESKEIILNPFLENESIQFILKHLTTSAHKEEEEEKEEAKELLNLLEYPLNKGIRPNVLNKLIAFVKLKLPASKIVDLQLIKQLREQRSKELKTKISDDEIFTLLIERNKKSWEVLKYSSFLDPDFIPVEMFTSLFDFDVNELENAVETLAELSLIKKEVKNKNVGLRMHQTLQMETQTFFKVNRSQEFENFPSELVDKISKKVDQYSYHYSTELADIFKYSFFCHFKRLTEKILTFENQSVYFKAKISLLFAQYLNINDLSRIEALEYLEQSLKIFRRIHQTDDHSDIAEALNSIGHVLIRGRQFNEGLESLQKSLKIYKTMCQSDKQAEIAVCLSSIAQVFQLQSRKEEALDFFEQSLETFKKCHGSDDHPNVANCLNNIAALLHNQGKHDEALTKLERSLEISKKICQTNEHADRAGKLNNIASVCQSPAKNEEAINHLNQSLESNKQLQATNNHANVASCLNNIGLILLKQGNHKEAFVKVTQSSIIYFKLYGEDNSSYAQSLTNIGLVLSRQEKHDKALDYMKRSLDIAIKIYNTFEHSFIATCLENIASILKLQGKLKEALDFYRLSFNVFKTVHKNDHHPDVTRTLVCCLNLDQACKATLRH